MVAAGDPALLTWSPGQGPAGLATLTTVINNTTVYMTFPLNLEVPAPGPVTLGFGADPMANGVTFLRPACPTG